MADHADSHLARLAEASSLSLLSELGFEWTALDRNVCAAAAFKRRGDDRPKMVALLGGASSGKSTLFNSLLGSEVSRISAHAHETVGPVAAVPTAWAERFDAWHREASVFPDLEAAALADGESTIGRVGALCVHRHQVAGLSDVVILDLPDVTSKMSADEGSITRTLLPWFDGLIIVADEERWFDAEVFDRTVEFARNLGPTFWIVFNRTENAPDLCAEDRQKLADHAQRRRAAGHCVSRFQPGAGYRPVAAATCDQLVTWAADVDAANRGAELERYLQGRCAEIVRANLARSEQFTRLCNEVNAELAKLGAETSLSADLLSDDERELLGLGRRLLPLYDVVQSVWRRLSRWRRSPGADGEIDFEKQTDRLSGVLRRNLEHRVRQASDRMDRIIADGPYLAEAGITWKGCWKTPQFDEHEWAVRIRAHIQAWKSETTTQTRRGDLASLSVGMPLLLADLLFLGGAGVTIAWAAVWVAGFVGGKSLTSLVQRSPAFKDYQTTVRAYQTWLREALTEQWEANLAAMPRRHLAMNDPVLQSVMYWSTPRGR